MKATLYDPDTGKITSTVTAGKQVDLDLNIPSGASWVAGEYSAKEYYIKDGAAVALPTKPDYPCYFDYTAETWVWDDAQSWADLRAKRAKLLQSTDWTQVPDAPVDSQAWATYRQALRDLPDNTEDPRNPVWPTKPN